MTDFEDPHYCESSPDKDGRRRLGILDEVLLFLRHAVADIPYVLEPKVELWDHYLHGRRDQIHSERPNVRAR
jgi:hypothetical protein